MSTTEPWRNPRPAPNLDEVRHRVPTKNMIAAWLRSWWPALVWAVVIFIFSTDGFSLQHTGRLIRKAAHLFEYFIFFVFIYRAMRRSRPGWHWSWAFGAWLIAVIYSGLDEFHQVFVASRGPSAWDSLLDSTGAFVALLTLFFLYRRFQRARLS